MSLIVNSAGFAVFIQCLNAQGQELGWNGGVIDPGVTRYIDADRISGNGGTCLCAVNEPVEVTEESGGFEIGEWVPGPKITSQTIKPHDLWYFIGGSMTTDSTDLQYTDDSNRLGW